MKRIILGMAIFLIGVSPVFAIKATDTCEYIKDGTIKDTLNQTIGLGYDQWGYNYEAHMFNGYYNNYSRLLVPVENGDRLMMKWNDAWLSNKDCGTQNGQANYTFQFEPDTKLDRHYPSSSYIGSGAWLTNHASGTYTSNSKYHWNLTGNYVMTFSLGGLWNHDLFLTETNGLLSGNGGYLAGSPPYSYWWHIISGTVSGDTFSFDFVYDGGPDAAGAITHVTGSIDSNTGMMSGAWNDNYLGGFREGTWSISTPATKVYETCKWSDFVKIVAVPTGASPEPDSNCPNTPYGLDDAKWTVNGETLGCSIWGSFAVIQEVANDSCEEKLDIRDYRGSLRSGLGDW